MNFFFYFFISLIGLAITFDELSESHQAAWRIYHDDIDSAEVLFNEALEEYREYLDTRREAVVLIDLATVYNKRGELVKHLQYLHKSESLVGQFEDSVISASLYSKLYVAYATLNNIDKALDYLKKQRLYISDNDSLAILNHFMNTADAYAKIGSYDLAKESIDQANKFTSLADENKKRIFNKYGVIFYKMGQPDSALKYFERASVYYDAWNNKVDLTSVLNYLSIKHEIMGNVTRKTLDSISGIIEKHKLNTDMPQLLALKANVLRDTNYMHRAIELNEKGNDIDFKVSLLKELADLQFELKHFDAHKRTLEIYHHLKDSISNFRNQHLLDDLSSAYAGGFESGKVKKDKGQGDRLLLYITLIAVLILASYIFYLQFKNKKKA